MRRPFVSFVFLCDKQRQAWGDRRTAASDRGAHRVRCTASTSSGRPTASLEERAARNAASFTTLASSAPLKPAKIRGGRGNVGRG